jgi:hypothetical protein
MLSTTILVMFFFCSCVTTRSRYQYRSGHLSPWKKWTMRDATESLLGVQFTVCSNRRGGESAIRALPWRANRLTSKPLCLIAIGKTSLLRLHVCPSIASTPRSDSEYYNVYSDMEYWLFVAHLNLQCARAEPQHLIRPGDLGVNHVQGGLELDNAG